MVVIRFARGGAKGRPFYHIVATDKQNRRDGGFIERLGYYNPIASGKEQVCNIALDRLNHWRSNGAEMSEAVERLVRSQAKKAA